MRAARQVLALLVLSLVGLRSRYGPLLVSVVGLLTVAMAVVSLLAIGTGFARLIGGAGRSNHVVLLSSGALSEDVSWISENAAQAVANLPFVKRDAGGRALVSAETIVPVQVEKSGEDGLTITSLRGVDSQWWRTRPEFRLTAGRLYRSGLRELIVGEKASSRFAHVRLGDEIILRGTRWRVVGRFSAQGRMEESDFLTDGATVRSAYQRTDVQRIDAVLESPRSFDSFRQALSRNTTIALDVYLESEYQARANRLLRSILRFAAFAIATLMALGAFYAALNAMYAAADTRRRELATMRAVGFRTPIIVLSFVLEGSALALLCGVAGGVAASALFDRREVLVAGTDVALAITPHLVVTGVIWVLVISILSATIAAWRTSREPMADALRSG